MPTDLRSISNFDDLLAYLGDELDWPVEDYTREELTFEYDADELGLKDEEVAKLSHGTIQQLRPLQGQQPFGIFFVEFDQAKLPIVILRRILSQLVIKKRSSANSAEAKRWDVSDLIFISAFGEKDHREIAFAHFHSDPETTDLPVLRVLGWHGDDTQLKSAAVTRTLKSRLSWPENDGDQEAWRLQWRSAFKHRPGHTISTSKELATAMAGFARRIRDAARAILPYESDNGRLRKLYKGFQDALIHDLSEEDFTTYYAETICYGLFTVAVSKTELSEGKYGTAMSADDVAHFVPVTNPFLKEMLWSFLEAGGRSQDLNFDDLGINEIVSFFNSTETDLPAVIRDFGSKRPGEDPVIHLYEDFLKQFDAELRKKRGVYYTPKPVVSYIVRSAHELLQTEFGLEDGLADTTTWGEMLELHCDLKLPLLTDLPGEQRTISPDEPFVQILDPATGTATFLVEAIEVIHGHLVGKWKQQALSRAQQLAAWNDYVPLHLLPRLHGYELMMAPYAIAHMKIGLKLAETGYRFATDERARVYLTNALLPWLQQIPLIGIEALAQEASAVNEIKRHKRFTIVIGNPAYSIRSGNLTVEAKRLIEPFKFIDGQRIVEKGALQLEKNLNDDYVKFFGLIRKLLATQSVGIVGLITNHAFLENPTFRGFRWNLLSQFSRIQILDLHGNSKKKEQVPKGYANENVFDIQQGVGISVMLRRPTESRLATVNLAEQWGTREEKFRALDARRFDYHSIECPAPWYKMTIQDSGLAAEFASFASLADAMPLNSTGIKTHRDAFVIDFDDQPLRERIAKFRGDSSNASIAEEYGIADTYGWKLSEARRRIRARRDWETAFQLCLYRPFDIRQIYYHGDLVELPRSECMRNLVGGRNLALLATRQITAPPFNHVLVTRLVSEMKTCSHDRGTNCFPLYLNDDGSSLQFSDERRLNFTDGFLQELSQALKITGSQENGVPSGLTPEDIFHYAYAVFHSSIYRTRYAEFLKTEFPRLPLTGNLEMFRALALFGGELTALHLLESPKLDKPITKFVGQFVEVTKITWADDTVWLDADGKKGATTSGTAGFCGVPEDVWNFHIGGYQVCHKWLKDRKGRTLTGEDITHYHKIVVALTETIRLMAEIDQVIETHGGWPGAFQSTSTK